MSLFEWFLLFAIKSTVVLMLALIVSKLLDKKASATVRSFIWVSTIYVIFILPFGHYIFPEIYLGLIDRQTEIYIPLSDISTTETPTENWATPATSLTEELQRKLSTVSPIQWVLFIWIVIAVCVYLRLLIGLLSVWWLAKNSDPVDNKEWNLLAIELGNELQLKRTVKLYVNDNATTPMTWGVFQPFIMLPKKAEDWSLERLKLVLIHEMAHVKRKDFITHIIAQLVSALLWFNPLVWVITKQLIFDREHACDDHVLEKNTKASDYASHLLDIAKSLRETHQSTFATLCMAKGSQLEGRLMNILDDERGHSVHSYRNHFFVIAAILAFTLPLSAIQPWDSTSATTQGIVETPSIPPTETISTVPPVEEINIQPEAEVTPVEAKEDEKAEKKERQEVVRTERKEKVKLRSSKRSKQANPTENSMAFAFTSQFSDELKTNLEKNGISMDGKSMKLSNLNNTLQLTMNAIEKTVEDVSDIGEETLANLSKEDLKALAEHGVDNEYIKQLIQYGLEHISAKNVMELIRYGINSERINEYEENDLNDLSYKSMTEFAKYGIDAEYAATVRKAGFSNKDVVKLRKYGVPAEFVTAVDTYGFPKPTAQDVISLFSHGVSATVMEDYSSRGLNNLSIKEMRYFTKYGITPEYVEAVTNLFPDASRSDILSLAKYGISTNYLHQLEQYRIADLNISTVIALGKYGVSTEFIRSIYRFGFSYINNRDMIDAAKYGVTPEFLDELKAENHKNISLEDIINLSKYGVGASYYTSIRKYFKDAKVSEILRMVKYGLNLNLIEELTDAGYTVRPDDAIFMAKYGVSKHFIRTLHKYNYKFTIEQIIYLTKYGVRVSHLNSLEKNNFKNISFYDLKKVGQYQIKPEEISQFCQSHHSDKSIKALIEKKHEEMANHKRYKH